MPSDPMVWMERSGEYTVEQLERKRLLDLVPEKETFATLERIAVEHQWYCKWDESDPEPGYRGRWVECSIGDEGARLDHNRAAIAFCGE